VLLVSQALLYRNLFLRPEKSWVPYSLVAYVRPTASFAVIHSGMFSLYLDYLFRLLM